MPNIAKYSKFITAVAGVAVEYLTAHHVATTWVSLIVAVATALGVYVVPNVTKPAAPPAEPSGGLPPVT
jgi:hypothetical protein